MQTDDDHEQDHEQHKDNDHSAILGAYAGVDCDPGDFLNADLRHTTITNAIEQGEDIMLVAAFAGHAKTSTTTDTYGHLMPQRAQDAAHRMRSVSVGADPRSNGAEATVGRQEGDPEQVASRTPSRTFPANDDGQRQTEAEADA